VAAHCLENLNDRAPRSPPALRPITRRTEKGETDDYERTDDHNSRCRPRRARHLHNPKATITLPIGLVNVGEVAQVLRALNRARTTEEH
jgi:hypothetical protein